MDTFKPAPASLDPTASRSIAIIESSAKLESEITGGVAAVSEVVSETSIVIGVDKISDPLS